MQPTRAEGRLAPGSGQRAEAAGAECGLGGPDSAHDEAYCVLSTGGPTQPSEAAAARCSHWENSRYLWSQQRPKQRASGGGWGSDEGEGRRGGQPGAPPRFSAALPGPDRCPLTGDRHQLPGSQDACRPGQGASARGRGRREGEAGGLRTPPSPGPGPAGWWAGPALPASAGASGWLGTWREGSAAVWGALHPEPRSRL